jgi:hypothetical protein
MAKLVAGVKPVQTSVVVPVRMPVTKYQTTNGRRFESPQAANDEQRSINVTSLRRAKRGPILNFLKANGVVYPKSGTISSSRLLDALLDPKFAAKLHAIAG